ncbi:MAG: NAD(P)-binding domain-containing protein [Granulosicoccus sp.]
MMRIGVVGTGTIAAAVVDGIAEDGHQITVSQRGEAHSSRLAGKYENVTVAGNQAVLDASDIIFLGLMADQARHVLSSLTFRPDQKVVSLMSGPTINELQVKVAPAIAVANMIPFPGIATGDSPILILGEAEIANALFGARNSIFQLADQSELAAYLAAQAVLSPATLMVQKAGEWLGDNVKDAAQGEAFLRALVGSSLQATPDCQHLIQALNTPGGYNQRLRLHMEASGFTKQLEEGLSTL